jgi:hypothetical protein
MIYHLANNYMKIGVLHGYFAEFRTPIPIYFEHYSNLVGTDQSGGTKEFSINSWGQFGSARMERTVAKVIISVIG